METSEEVAIGYGRGRGNATNVPERELIEQVRIRPLLYDKSRADYRKPGVSDTAWMEVATAVNSSVSNCKRRWKSLRDTFIKYYRLEVMYSNSDRRRHKIWNFYSDLTFLKQHVELFRLDDVVKDGNETFSQFPKDSNRNSCDSEPSYIVEEDDTKEVYEIKIAEVFEREDSETYRIQQDQLEVFEEQIEEDFGITEEEETINKSPEKGFNDHCEAIGSENEIEEQTEETEEVFYEPIPAPSNRLQSDTENDKNPPDSSQNISSPSKNTVDPDERYLMSCLPAFKRFTPQQKAYVRMGIEKLFYEVEFENVSEPRNKKPRTS